MVEAREREQDRNALGGPTIMAWQKGMRMELGGHLLVLAPF